jgi:hypothetical protein
MMRFVVPDSGKGGEVLEIQGESLAQDSVAAVYLTNEVGDTKVTIVEQTATTLRFKIPVTLASGRYSITVLSTDDPPRLIDEPVKITVLPVTAGSVN